MYIASMGIYGNIKSAVSGIWQRASAWVPRSVGDGGGLVHVRPEDYMHIAAYFACIRNISEDIGKLPLVTYRRLSRGKERATEHPLYQLLRTRPNKNYSANSFRETLTRYALAYGNGYARIHRLADDVPYSLEIIPPHFVLIGTDESGEVVYRIAIGAERETIPARDMIHIHGVSSNGVDGMSVLQAARCTLDFAESAQKYGENIYARGGRPGGILTVPNKLGAEAKTNIGKAWELAYGAGQSGKTAVLDNGATWQAVSINPVDAQYLETRQFSVEEIARWFRMPLHKIQYLVRAQGWSTLDAQNTDYLTDTLMPWLIRWESELNYKLFGLDSEYFAEHLITGLLRGDQKTRSEFYIKQFSIGALSINEIREMENMNPIEGDAGDKHFVPLNMTPAEFAGKVIGGKDNA